MAELVFLYYASASSMPSSNKRFSRSFVTSGSRSSQECHCWLAPSARHSSTIRIITHLYSRANGNLLPKGPTTDHERPQTGKQRDDLFKSGVCQQSFTKSVEDPTGCATSCTSQAKWLQMVLHGIYGFGTKWNCCRIARKPRGREGGCWKQTGILCPPDPLRGIGHYLETASVLASSSLVSSSQEN